ncbi:MAG TPA: HAD hydrolase family protein, partial [Gemmatimonadales bacterium]|nr:HAD hydrolase family protein [Gemmatimonadales bacterium]
MLKPALARRLKLVGFDVDGVLTDGGLYVGESATHQMELKRFHIQDGLGVKFLRQAGLVVVLASARRSEATALRGRELKVDEIVQDNPKLAPFATILARRGVAWDECAFVGDDLPDLPVLTRVALPIAVANAVPEVKAAATFVTKHSGGDGAVREVAEIILKARGVWKGLLQQYLQERGDVEARPPA